MAQESRAEYFRERRKNKKQFSVLSNRELVESLEAKLKEQGKTIFAITHDDAYFDSADRIFLAQNGEISELKGENIKELAKNLVEKFD